MNRDTHVVLLHHAGGSSAAFDPLLARLPRRSGIHALDLPGRVGSDQPGPTALDDALHRLSSEVRARLPDGARIAVAGHSLGGLLAVLLAARLAGSGGPEPVWVGVSAASPPGFPTSSESAESAESAESIESPERQDTPAAALLHLPPRQLRRTLEGLGAFGPRVPGDDAWAVIEPRVRADLVLAAEATAALRTLPAIDVPLTAFAGEEDPLADPGRAQGWSRHSTRFRGVRRHPGDHFWLLRQPDRLASALADELALTLDGPDAWPAGTEDTTASTSLVAVPDSLEEPALPASRRGGFDRSQPAHEAPDHAARPA